MSSKSVYVVAGEASGDLHGANLVRALKKLDPSLRTAGAGGERMRAAVDGSFVRTAHLNVTGLTEVLKHIPGYLKLADHVTQSVREARPDAVVFIDNPGFNLRLAKRLGSSGVPLVYYICPQVWAWGRGRLEFMKKTFKKALVVFRFEEEFYRRHGMPASFVGHPLKDALYSGFHDRSDPSSAPRILLLPGSRPNEVTSLLPIMLQSAGRIRQQIPAAHFALLKAPGLPADLYAKFLDGSLKVEIIEDNKHARMREADITLVCSGTATLECALLDLPMIVLYRASFVTFLAAKLLVRVKFLALPNLLAGKEIVPELLQYNAVPEKIAREALRILREPGAAAEMKRNLREVTDDLGPPRASETAAREILKLIA